MEAIIAHVREGNAVEIRDWIENANNDLDVGDEHAFSLLHWASREGKLEIVEMLLLHGARANITNKGFDTPLHLAAAHGHYNVVKQLINYYFDSIDIPNEYGNTPLHYACFWGHIDIADVLIDRHASIDLLNDNGQSPLDVAPLNLKDRIRKKAPHGGIQQPHYSLQARNFQGQELLAKDQILSRLEDSRYEPKDIRTTTTDWGDYNTKYYFGEFLDNIIMIRMIEARKITQRLERDVIEEANKLKIFNHKNILPVLGYMVSDTKICFFTEKVSQGPLFNVIHDRKISQEISWRQGLRFSVDIARAMVFLHSPELKVSSFRLNSKHIMICDDQARIHLMGDDNYDLKPDKRHLFDQEYLMARINLAECSIDSLFKSREYNPAWMSPESLKNKPNNINIQASDVWSFGIILWEIITREIPFKNVEPMAVGIQIATESLRLPLTHNDRVNRLFKLCTNNEPKNRPRFDMLIPILDKMLEREKYP